ncbi:MAG: glutamine synthetase family protein [Clostridia bacterium]
MSTTIKDIMSFVKENDVKFIRLAFCDPFGVHKNISIMSDELESAFIDGVSFDASAIDGFADVAQSDLLLIPDPSTLTVLPWRPYPGRVIRFYCKVTYLDKTPFEADSRHILKQALVRASQMGYACDIGSKCEFYLFKTNEDGEPTKITLDQGGFFDISPLDKGEDIRREICLYLEEMGLNPENSHHEKGPGQNEIDFKSSDALTAADNLLTFKSAVKSIAERNGLYASFMPKPLLNESGSGLHINLSLYNRGVNIFKDIEGNKAGRSFVEGVLQKTAEMTLFLNPIINSYERLGKCEAPTYVSWSRQNRSHLIRMPIKSEELSYMELRSPDSSVNPYIAFALIIHAGLDGIEQKLELRDASTQNLYIENDTKDLQSIPNTLSKALEVAKASEFISNYLDENMLSKYFDAKEKEILELEKSTGREDFYAQKYFKKI